MRTGWFNRDMTSSRSCTQEGKGPHCGDQKQRKCQPRDWCSGDKGVGVPILMLSSVAQARVCGGLDPSHRRSKKSNEGEV